MFVAISAFHAKIADPHIGGTYMTLLATVSNLGGTFPRFFILKFVDYFTQATCYPPSSPIKDTSVLKGDLITQQFSCVSEAEKHRCVDGGGSCVIGQDGELTLLKAKFEDFRLTGSRLLHRQCIMCDLRRNNVLGIHQTCGVEAAGFTFTSLENDGIALHISVRIVLYKIFGKQTHWNAISFELSDSLLFSSCALLEGKLEFHLRIADVKALNAEWFALAGATNQSSTNQAFLPVKEGVRGRAWPAVTSPDQASRTHLTASLRPLCLHRSSWPATVTSE